MRASLLSVNPSLLTGDLPKLDYDTFGAVFLTHGFPMNSINVISDRYYDMYQDELAKGHTISSPALTREVIMAAMRLLDPRANHSDILIRDPRNSDFRRWNDRLFVMHNDPFTTLRQPRYSRHLSANTRRELSGDTLSSSEANHCINAVDALAAADSGNGSNYLTNDAIDNSGADYSYSYD